MDGSREGSIDGTSVGMRRGSRQGSRRDSRANGSGTDAVINGGDRSSSCDIRKVGRKGSRHGVAESVPGKTGAANTGSRLSSRQATSSRTMVNEDKGGEGCKGVDENDAGKGSRRRSRKSSSRNKWLIKSARVNSSSGSSNSSSSNSSSDTSSGSSMRGARGRPGTSGSNRVVGDKTHATGSSDSGHEEGGSVGGGVADILTLMHDVTRSGDRDDNSTPSSPLSAGVHRDGHSDTRNASASNSDNSDTEDTLTPGGGHRVQGKSKSRSLWTTTKHEGDNYSVSELSIAVSDLIYSFLISLY